MKFIYIPSLFTMLFVLTACPGRQYENAQKKLYKNHMDLPTAVKRSHDGIHFKISELFENSYDKDFVLKANATTKIIYDLDLNFSVESFDKNEAEAFKFAFSDDIDLLNAVHDQYIVKRQNSLYDHFTSIKKKAPKNVGFNGITQTIEGKTYEDEGFCTYFMSTIQVGDKYYVFQMIGMKDNMGYLYDDFLEIIKSIEK